MHIAVLVANTDESDFAQRHPKDGAKFAGLLQGLRPDWQVNSFSVKDGEFPAEAARFDGWIITGSPASVHDSDAWVRRLLGLIRQIVARREPLFGACFGHQAIAVALGGVVGDNPGGWVFGAVDTVMEGAEIRLYAAHREQVLVVPERAVVLGGNAECAVGSFAIGQSVLTTQYHPEMTQGFMTALVAEYADKLPAEVAARARESLAVAADRDVIAARMVRFFEEAAVEPLL
ncbi:type 1 glutamine amidotransferase [Cypionkella sp.]|uniref:type 1 glutamine amidotransferase n=1 Tax=Cypionkella sp. TaxID=2811411 RepID=UPI002ABB9148|nr:type 1 glutamine amidotransferase [Cypionkella sp.]MDZ4395093.1 type 1 glutamine amidotransferase [Cypionkella sp.]